MAAATGRTGVAFRNALVVLRFCFKDMPGVATLTAKWMEAEEWRKWWIQEHPETKPELTMCVYYYKK